MGASPQAGRGLMRTFSTSEAGNILAVSSRTVARLCDEGRLGHYRIGGGGRPADRRIPQADLIAFMFQTPGLAKYISKVLGSNGAILVGLCDRLCSLIPPNVSIARCRDLFELGSAASLGPRCVILDATALGTAAAIEGATHLREMCCPVAVLLPEDGAKAKQFQSLGCEVYWSPVSPEVVAAVVMQFLGG